MIEWLRDFMSWARDACACFRWDLHIWLDDDE